MPIHEWSRVDAGVFHHFHQAWIIAITQALNGGLLPPDYYAMAEQRGAGFEPDVLTLKTQSDPELQEPSTNGGPAHHEGGGQVLVAEPTVRIRAETDLDFYRRKQNVVAVRHASGDALVAMVEIVSEPDKPLTLAAYEADGGIRAFVEPLAVGDTLTPMPLYLRPGEYVLVPLEETYQAAWQGVPRRWREVIA